MTTFFADTNIFLRFLLGDVPFQYQLAKEYLQRAKKGHIKIVVCPIVVFEIFLALNEPYGFDKNKVTKALKTIVKMDYLEIEDRQNLIQALRLYQQQNMDLTDCFLFVKAKNAAGEVLSFNKDFKRLED